MARKHKDTVEFRYYEIPQSAAALVLCGQTWERQYGHEQTGLHFHNLMEIGICRHGEGDMFYEDEKLPYQDGTITVIPANYPHVTISRGEETNLWEYLFFDLGTILERLFPEDLLFRQKAEETLNRRAVISTEEELSVLADHINSVVEETNQSKEFVQRAIWLHMEAIVLELLRFDASISEETAATAKGSNMGQIALALDYVSKNYDKNIKAGELADLCSMSETHFRRLFEEYINMSPLDYVNMVRIQKACEMIKKTSYSMETVAEKCGFTNVTTFNRNFKKYLNTSPYQWKINPDNYEGRLLNFRISALKGW